jgi:hypothetical protein
MRDWLSIELLLGTLLVTTFTCIGTLALWTATSRRHWFIRAVVVFAILCPLLIIPAQGLFITFSLEIVLVAVGFIVARLIRRWREHRLRQIQGTEIPNARWQFSVKSALAVCTCVAVISAIIVWIPESSWLWWPVIVATSAITAIITLVAAWVVYGKSWFLVRALCAIFLIAAVIGIGAFNSKGFEVRWRMAGDALSDHFSIYENQARLLAIAAIGLFSAIIITLLLARAALSPNSFNETVRKRSLAPLALTFWLLIMFAPPALALVMLLTPLHVPDNALPVPNGYDQLVAIGMIFEKSAIQTELWADPVDKTKLFASVPKYAAEFDALHTALKVPFRMPVNYNVLTDIDTEATMALRRLEKVLKAKSAAALQTGDVTESLACRSDTLRLAESLHQGGLLLHVMMSAAIEEASLDGTYKLLPHMNAEQCKAEIRELTDYDRRREPWSEVIHREKVWIRKTSGWPGALGYGIQYLSNDDGLWGTFAYVRGPHPRVQTLCHLLIAELAIRAHKLDRGKPPLTTADLVPDYLATFPTDPFDANNSPLRAQVSNGQLKVWSVGNDRDDDGGKPLPRTDTGYPDFSGDGDLWLADFFEPDEF